MDECNSLIICSCPLIPQVSSLSLSPNFAPVLILVRKEGETANGKADDVDV